MNNLTTYECIGNPSVQSTTTIDKWLELTKNNPDADLVAVARRYKAQYVATGDLSKKKKYDNIKSTFPTICYNSVIDGYRIIKNIISSTGLMYIDVDIEGFNIEEVDKTKIYSYYKSLGGLGYTILIRVDGLDINNYESTFSYIIDDLGLNDFYDPCAKGMAQQAVLSYDPDIFINSNSFIYTSSTVLNKKGTPSVVNKKENNIYDTGGAFLENKMRYDNTDTIDIEGDYVVNWDGYRIVKAWIPIHKIPDGKRYRYFLGYANNLLSLNQHLTYVGLLNNLKHVNPVACVNPIAESQLIKIANSIVKQNDAGNLIPIEFNKKRKVVFSKNCKLDKETKLAICRSEVAKHRIEESKVKIKAIIESWDFDRFGKITQPAIVQHHSISRKTVQKYWSEFKEFVSNWNAEFNQNKHFKEIVSKNIGAIEHTIIPAAIVMPVVERRFDYDPASDVYELLLKTETYFFGHFSIIVNDYPDDDDQIMFMNKLMEQPSGDDQVILFNGKSYKFDKATLGNDTLIDLVA